MLSHIFFLVVQQAVSVHVNEGETLVEKRLLSSFVQKTTTE